MAVGSKPALDLEASTMARGPLAIDTDVGIGVDGTSCKLATVGSGAASDPPAALVGSKPSVDANAIAW